MKVPPPPSRGNRGAQETSARRFEHARPTPEAPLDARERAIVERALAGALPSLRAVLVEALAAERPRPPASPRLGAREGDLDAPVDEITRARARRLLARHGGGR